MSGIPVIRPFGRLVASGGAALWCAAADQLAYGLMPRDPRGPKAPAGMAPDLCRSAGERSP
jgi:hypothetical protein